MADVTTDTGRRSVQTDLQRLGYYAGSVDGIFGPDSRAAIRRLQHELGDSLTGRLTPAEIMQLQARAR
jgi:peptidoglycan hydrolase-like protein with peptidoglycan-binding domain